MVMMTYIFVLERAVFLNVRYTIHHSLLDFVRHLPKYCINNKRIQIIINIFIEQRLPISHVEFDSVHQVLVFGPRFVHSNDHITYRTHNHGKH